MPKKHQKQLPEAALPTHRMEAIGKPGLARCDPGRGGSTDAGHHATGNALHL
jgi:hypothetical protein